MGFLKALQLQPKIEGQDEYAAALMLYRSQCSVNKRLCKELEKKAGFDPSAELMLYRQEKEFSQQCKVYNKARNKWKLDQISHKLSSKKLKLGELTLNEYLALASEGHYKNTRDDIFEMSKKNAAVSSMTGEQEEFIKRTLLENLSKSKQPQELITGGEFNLNGANDPTLGDFDPL